MAEATNDVVAVAENAAPEKSNSEANGAAPAPVVDDGVEPNPEDAMFMLNVVLPHEPGKVNIMVSPHEQVHEVRQSIIELPAALQYSCFHLEHKGERINDFIAINEISGIGPDADIHLVEDPYTEKEARIHLIRVRELIGASGDRTDTIQGVLAGASLYEKVAIEAGDTADKTDQERAAVEEYNFDLVPPVSSLLPAEQEPAPKTVKAIQLSPWNPPPVHLRQKGHLLYLIVTTNEGEQFQITAHVGGFFVNKSSNAKFNPSPRLAPKGASAHSLLNLISDISPSFAASFAQLQEYNNRREPLATFQITNAIPSAPWVVPSSSSPLCAHQPDITRTQESYLIAGVENTDTLRDWNEEFQSAKELPKENVQDRVFRERLLAKLYADYNDAAARGAVQVARGEVAPLNPTEARDAQIYVYNNVFFSFGADGVGTFTSEGGDEAARVATGKDVAGVKVVNQLDIDGLYTPGTVVVDYLGKRIVGQSIVPGIFKQREPGENQIDYGAVDGKDVVAANEKFTSVFEKLSQAMKVKKHAVWDKDGKRFDLEASVETKGLLGTDGRKYVLDLYRITPLDIAWLEETAAEEETNPYPHRMTVLRGELVELVHRHKMREWVNAEIQKRADAKKDAEASEESNGEKPALEGAENKKDETAGDEEKAEKAEKAEKPEDQAVEKAEKTDDQDDRIDVNNFKFALNPDVFSGQEPQTDAEKEELESDEQDVRAACAYLRNSAIPELLNDLKESDISFPMDGTSLRNLLHKRGINMRYLGKIASLSEGSRLQCLRDVCVRDMIVRSFKHVAAKYLRYLPLPLTSTCIAHLLNCFLGVGLNAKPSADIDRSLRALYSDADLSFETVTPESLRKDVELETSQRFRFKLDPEWHAQLSPVQVLREVCLKLGLQVQSKEYAFTPGSAPEPAVAETPAVNGSSEGSKKKKNKKAREGSPASIASSTTVPHTFTADDIVNVVPIVKDSSPRSSLAEEALEAGRISIAQNQRKLGQELLLESLSLHEQIHGILHPEVARVYHQLSMLYFQLDEKEAAVELARKAIMVAERTVGIDAQETLLDYLNLSLFLHQLGDSRSALEYAKHALQLWKIIYGPDHPDTITTINNAAVMLQHLKAYHESRRWFEESLRICDKVFGKQSINSATLLFQLAQALALDQDPKGAVNRMRESYNIFLQELGAEDKNTKEAESWLEQLTQNAVSIAKHEKDVQARRLRAGIRFTPRNLVSGVRSGVAGGITSQPAGVASHEVQGKPSLDARNIDELIKFIEGGADKTSKSGGGKKTAGRSKNPKSRRGGSQVPTKA